MRWILHLAPFLGVVLAVSCGREETTPPRPSGSEEAAYGRFKRARVDPALERRIRELEGIGYLTGSKEAPADSGVVVHDREKAWPGLNFYVSGHAPSAVLMDMEGRILHRWRCSFEEAFPDFPAERMRMEKEHMRQYWRRARLDRQGRVLAIFEGHGLVHLDRGSRVLWSWPGKAHHDLDVDGEGNIWVLCRTAHLVPRIHRTEPILEDFVAVLSPDGREIRRFSILEAFERSGFASFLQRMPRHGDILHTNTLEILDGSLADRVPAFAAGNLLVSCLKLDTIAVIDPRRERVVWAAAGSWKRQHQPTVVDGRILLFDNKGGDEPGGRSRVLEIDPVTRRIVWSYEGTPDRPFHSDTCGSCQRLPNGNTLITESDYGRAFEVTRDGEIVWEYLNPHRAGQRGELIATLFELIRLPEDYASAWLER